MFAGIISSLFSDPQTTLIALLLALPGRLLAISAHEAAHGWVADRCGDPTARNMGRVTLNPARHLDPVGVLCMVFLGIGWAKPVPINPRNYKNYRRDDLLVSLAGITMNIILFLLGCIIMYVVIGIAIASLPVITVYSAADETVFRTTIDGVSALVSGEYWYDLADALHYGVSLTDVIIVPAFGKIAGYVYDMLGYFISTNLVLAVFNLIPIPPLDGYHVLNDTILRRRQLFVSRKSQSIGMIVLYALMLSGILSQGLNWGYSKSLYGLGDVAGAIFGALGLI